MESPQQEKNSLEAVYSLFTPVWYAEVNDYEEEDSHIVLICIHVEESRRFHEDLVALFLLVGFLIQCKMGYSSSLEW